MIEYIYEHKPSGADHMGKPVELPTLVQREEIVRCRDCAYFKQTTEFGICEQPEFLPLYAKADGFCAWAKRK